MNIIKDIKALNSQPDKIKLKLRPIPTLKETQKNYLKFVKPFLTNKNDLDYYERLFSKFTENEGVTLQKRFRDYTKFFSSWLYDYNQDIYLYNKKPILFYSNYLILYDLSFKDQIDATSKIIMSCIHLKTLILDNNIKNLTQKDYLQYFYLFHSIRYPVINSKDQINVFDFSDNNYVIVIYKNIFWLIELLDIYNNLKDQISYILSIDLKESDDKFFGYLSANNRNCWAENREIFYNICDENKEFLNLLEKSLFIVNLYDYTLEEEKKKYLENQNKYIWLGENQNKFFDKILQISVYKDSKIGFLLQKSCVDFSVAVEMAKYLKKFNEEDFKKNNSINDEGFSIKPTKLNYKLNSLLYNEIKKSIINIREITEKIYSQSFKFKDYGKNLLERKSIDIIGFINLAILASYYRANNKIVPSRQYNCGRHFSSGTSEWIRTTTKESANFAIAMNEIRIPRELKIKLGIDSLKANKNITKEVISGKSIDTHLTGLYSTLKFNEQIPEIFNDKVFKESSNWVLEVFPILNENINNFFFGYTHETEGLSVTYIVKKNEILFDCFSAKEIKKFIFSLNEILIEMKDLFLEKEKNRPKF